MTVEPNKSKPKSGTQSVNCVLKNGILKLDE
jgi:hypothetical protein